MLYLLIGPYEVRLAARNKTLKGRVPNELEHPSRELLLERAGASSLFGEEGVYLARNILAEDESLLEVFPELVESASLFIFEEESATADVKKRAKEAGANVQEGKAEAKERLNTFALADALGTRDKKKAWALLIEFLRQGAKP